jgi:hypothetical protein
VSGPAATAGCGPAAPARRRGRESGQALLFALLALFIASMAAAFVAEDLALRERALQEESVRMRLRAMLDGALADALARIAVKAPIERELRWGAGRTTAEEEEIGALRVRLRIVASYAGRRAAVDAVVQKSLSRPPRVVEWHRGYAG